MNQNQKLHQQQMEDISVPKNHVWFGAFHWRVGKLPWGKALGAALTMGICLLAGDALGHLSWGLLATVGGFTALYVHNESYIQRAKKLAWVGLGLAAALGIGTISASATWSMSVALGCVGFTSTFLAGTWKVPPPAGYMFVLACALGTGLPLDSHAALLRSFIALAGAAVAWGISMAGWLFQPRKSKQNDGAVNKTAVLDVYKNAFSWQSLVIQAGLRMGITLFLATWVSHWLGNPRPYWVPLTCASVLQGATVVATLHRTIQRAAGTLLGAILGAFVLTAHLSTMELVASLMVFQFVTELLIVRNYGAAVVFITPLPLILAEVGFPGIEASWLIHARCWDTLLGCSVGLTAAFLFWRMPLRVRKPSR